MNRTIVINLIGAPCAGKSTLAALVFSKLKMNNISCEIVTEFAKDLVWDESLQGLNNQLYVFSEQFYRVWRLQNKVDVIVTDSPMLLSIYYNRKQKEENKLSEKYFNPLILECNDKYDNLNFFVKRNYSYDNKGRRHNEEESNKIEQDMLILYKDMNINYQEVVSDEESANMIVNITKKKLGEI